MRCSFSCFFSDGGILFNNPVGFADFEIAVAGCFAANCPTSYCMQWLVLAARKKRSLPLALRFSRSHSRLQGGDLPLQSLRLAFRLSARNYLELQGLAHLVHCCL